MDIRDLYPSDSDDEMVTKTTPTDNIVNFEDFDSEDLFQPSPSPFRLRFVFSHRNRFSIWRVLSFLIIWSFTFVIFFFTNFDDEAYTLDFNLDYSFFELGVENAFNSFFKSDLDWFSTTEGEELTSLLADQSTYTSQEVRALYTHARINSKPEVLYTA